MKALGPSRKIHEKICTVTRCESNSLPSFHLCVFTPVRLHKSPWNGFQKMIWRSRNHQNRRRWYLWFFNHQYLSLPHLLTKKNEVIFQGTFWGPTIVPFRPQGGIHFLPSWKACRFETTETRQKLFEPRTRKPSVIYKTWTSSNLYLYRKKNNTKQTCELLYQIWSEYLCHHIVGLSDLTVVFILPQSPHQPSHHDRPLFFLAEQGCKIPRNINSFRITEVETERSWH